MDRNTMILRLKQFFQTYRYPVLILLLGICLMLYPGKQDTDLSSDIPIPEKIAEPTLEEKLSDLLSQLQGAGRVRVLLTQATGEETIFQTNQQLSSDANSCSERSETVIVSDNARMQSGIIRQRNPPTYLGAVVLSQGADRAAVRLAIVEAVSNAVGLSYDKITVLKMK